MLEAILALGLILNVQDEATPPCNEECVAEQLPEEVIGRQITDEDGVEWVVAALDSDGNQILILAKPTEIVGVPLVIENDPETVVEIPATTQLAETGGFNQGLAAIALALIVVGAGLLSPTRWG